MTYILEYNCDPAHATGSVTGRPKVREIQRTYLCSECHAQFTSEDRLGEHLTAEHPTLQPYLLVDGTRVPQTSIIRRQPADSALRTVNTTRVELGENGKPLRPIQPKDLVQILGRTRYGVVELHLHNQRASRRYDIRILVPEEGELQRVEDEFRSHLARTEVTVSDIRHFDEALCIGPGAADYASGLADYVYGVLAKDGGGQTTLPFTEFPAKFRQSLGILDAFVERPLAVAVASCIRFNLNDFRSPWRPCEVPRLDDAFLFFRQRALASESEPTPPSPPQTDSATPLCPVDSVTDYILSLVRDLGSISALRDMASRYDLSDEDRVKVYVLLADRVADLKQKDVAACRAALEYDPIFQRWADRVL